jgi:hypothetical protein
LFPPARLWRARTTSAARPRGHVAAMGHAAENALGRIRPGLAWSIVSPCTPSVDDGVLTIGRYPRRNTASDPSTPPRRWISSPRMQS